MVSLINLTRGAVWRIHGARAFYTQGIRERRHHPVGNKVTMVSGTKGVKKQGQDGEETE